MIEQIFSLKGKKAIVTGATGSIGYACVQALLSFGASVLIVGRKKEKLIEIEQRLQKDMLQTSHHNATQHAPNHQTVHQNKVQAQSHQLDCNDIAAMKKFFSNHNDTDIFVNSVGTNIPKPLLEMSEQDYDTLMDTNVKSAFFQTQCFVAAKTEKEKRTTQSSPASIIHISSQMGFVGGDERSIYCASKHAMQGMCKAIALEIGKWNMRINTICPTFIETELTRSTLVDAEKRKKITQSIVFERLGELQDIYGAVVYLASDASRLVTGTAITVDGGWTAR